MSRSIRTQLVSATSEVFSQSVTQVSWSVLMLTLAWSYRGDSTPSHRQKESRSPKWPAQSMGGVVR